MTVQGLSLACAAFLALTAAAGAADLKITAINDYLVWEDTGKLSKNLADVTDQIVANGEDGSSVQMIVDVVVAGEPNSLHEETPVLVVTASRPEGYSDEPALVEKRFPISFVGPTGRVYRSVVVDHDCNPFVLRAFLETGGRKGRAVTRDVGLTCGD